MRGGEAAVAQERPAAGRSIDLRWTCGIPLMNLAKIMPAWVVGIALGSGSLFGLRGGRLVRRHQRRVPGRRLTGGGVAGDLAGGAAAGGWW